MVAKQSKKTERVPEHVGKLMRKWRMVAGMSLETVGDAIGCSKGHLSAVENGKGNLSLPLFLAFCEKVGAPASKVLEHRLLSKHRDVDRLAAEIVSVGGARELEWLASLDKAEFRMAIHAARDRVELERLRSQHRDDDARSNTR